MSNVKAIVTEYMEIKDAMDRINADPEMKVIFDEEYSRLDRQQQTSRRFGVLKGDQRFINRAVVNTARAFSFVWVIFAGSVL